VQLLIFLLSPAVAEVLAAQPLMDLAVAEVLAV
jgi:hypothetical protein